MALPKQQGPTHPYVTTSPECWSLFNQTALERQYRLLSDAYMAQHPDGEDPRQVQSVAVHLITLEAVLVGRQPLKTASAVTAAAVDLGRAMGGYRRLHRPETWTATIADVAESQIEPEMYAREVLESWHAMEGPQIERWVVETLDYLYGS